MRFLLGLITAIATLGLALAALAQSSSPNPPAPPPVQTNSAPAAPVAESKLFACQIAVKGLQGQERQDQMQLCRAQAHLDCLKQAIDQKIVGPQRRDFMRTCLQQ
jgi:psiF repeat-containing protein